VREEREKKKKKKTPKREMRVREERTKKKKRIDDLREEAVARDEKLKREARVLFFSFLYAYAGHCKAGWVLAGKKLVYPQPTLPRTGWIKSNPNP
jgi:predicted transcriptional regulator